MLKLLREYLIKWEGKIVTPPKKAIISVLEFIYLWYEEVIRDRCLQRSASLTYTTLLAIFPMIAVMALFVPAFFGGTQEMEKEVIGYVESILLPDAGQDIEGSIRGYFEVFRKNSRTVGLFGILGLMISALLMFSNVEKSFNEIWRSRRHRSVVALFSRFTTILVLVPLLIGASIILTANLTKHVQLVGRLFSLLVPYIITCLALTLAFFILPNTKVKFIYAFIGGFFAGLLWEIAKVAFGYYVSNPKITLIYKSLGAIPIFLIWSYFTWLIVLLGCELSYLLQNYKRLQYETFRKIPHTVLDSKLVFLVFFVIAEQYQKEKGGTSFSHLLKKVTIKYEELENLIDLLKEKGVITETENGLFIPSRPLDKLKPMDLLHLGCKVDNLYLKESEDDIPTCLTLEQLQKFVVSWSEGKSIRDLFPDPKVKISREVTK